MILLALDLGAKRTGVAVSKEGHVFGRDTIAGWENYGALVLALRDIINKDEIEKVVVGIPKSQTGDAERKIIEIVDRLKKDTGIAFEKIDETLTSAEANRRMADNNGENDDNREAAKIILEDYLAHSNNNN